MLSMRDVIYLEVKFVDLLWPIRVTKAIGQGNQRLTGECQGKGYIVYNGMFAMESSCRHNMP